MNRFIAMLATFGVVGLALLIFILDVTTTAALYDTCGVTASNFIFLELKRFLYVVFGTC